MNNLATLIIGRVSQRFSKKLLKHCKSNLVFFQSASVSYMRPTYGEPFGYEEPFPYEKKRFTLWQEVFDKTVHRFNDNTKAILVEGGPGIGKTDFAHRLAKEFDLKVFDSIHDDKLYIDENGYDLRMLNQFLTPRISYYTTEMFYNRDPSDKLGCKLQWKMYEEKYYQYCAALYHLMNTGQGVVIVRSAFSDLVYAEAMRACNYMSKEALDYYYDLRSNTICDLIKPHLTIYLDTPIEMWKERTFKKNQYCEEKSIAFNNDKYLSKLESLFKEKFLPDMQKYGEVMTVDWTTVADDLDMDAIAQEISRINLASVDHEELKFLEWYRNDEDDWGMLRKCYGNESLLRRLTLMHFPFECPECVPDEEESKVIENLNDHPIMAYKKGWCPDLGYKTAWRFM